MHLGKLALSVGGKCNIQLATVCNVAELQRLDRAPRTLQDPPAPGPGPLIPDLGQGALAKIRTCFATLAKIRT